MISLLPLSSRGTLTTMTSAAAAALSLAAPPALEEEEEEGEEEGEATSPFLTSNLTTPPLWL